MRKSILTLLTLLALMLPAGCARQSTLGTVTLAVYPGNEQEALQQLTRLMLEDREYAVERRTYESLTAAHAALKTGEADLLWAYGWDAWHQALKHDVTCGDAESLFEHVGAEDAANGITWVSAAPCLRFGSLVVRATDEALKDVHSISALVAHVQQKDPELSLCDPSPRFEQPGGIGAMMRYYGLELQSERTFKESYDGCAERVAAGECDVTYALNTDPSLVDRDLRLIDDDRRFFQRSYLSVALSSTILRAYPDLERTLKELSAVLTCQTLIDLQREALGGRTTIAKAAQNLLEDRRVIGSRRRRPTRVWE